MVRPALRENYFIPRTPRIKPQRRPGSLKVNYLFIYGTLRQGSCNHSMIPSALELETGAQIKGLLFQLDRLPLLVPAEDLHLLKTTESLDAGYVYGDLVRLPVNPVRRQALLKSLDKFEGVGPANQTQRGYRRVLVSVSRNDSSTVQAWAYAAPSSRLAQLRQQATLLPYGDWQGGQRAGTTPGLRGAGDEAVSFAVKKLGLLHQAKALVFLEGVLWAAQGKPFSQTEDRLSKLVAHYRQSTRAIADNPFILRQGFEIEWWPAGFAPLIKEESPHPLTRRLDDFRLITSKAGLGEYASFPSQRVELQAHLFELIRRLGLFPPGLSYSLHLNFGFPFKMPYYSFELGEKIPGETAELPAPFLEHPALYEALTLIWLPLGLLSLSAERWDNLWRQGEQLRSIHHPFFFHHENVSGGDLSRLEYRVFEIAPSAPTSSFVTLATHLHHLTVALFWKELAWQKGNPMTQEKFKGLGYLWENYAQRMRTILTAAGLKAPNYFSPHPFIQNGLLPAFQKELRDYRLQHPQVTRQIARTIQASFSAIDKVIGQPRDFSFPLPPPLSTENDTFLAS